MQNISSNHVLIISSHSPSHGQVFMTSRTSVNGTQSPHILVKRENNGWQPVTSLNSSIDRYRFQNEYGFLPADAQSKEEVLNSGLHFDKAHSRFVVGEEIAFNSDGQFVIHSKEMKLSDGGRPSHSDRTEIMEVHYDDSEWSVPAV